ncbi:hypothetical protein LUZ61_016070 [Rhynchospora tenuis]|uniref:Uncharacterized protein n=1 Tax=Rhynchospora tenuis TaxID=198213 RepID=A0AAD5Z4V5_9POAL|nr:hypothetical protein LUZ61_016070 [Rhynchospora tenuis]
MDIEQGGSSSRGGFRAQDPASISNGDSKSRDVKETLIEETNPRGTSKSLATSRFQRELSNTTRMRLLNQRNAVPTVVAIGPYHHACGGLYFSEEYKKQMLLLDCCFIYFTLKRLGCDRLADLHEAIKRIQVQGDHARLRQETSFLASDVFTYQEEIRLDLIMHDNQIPFSVIYLLLETNPVLKTFINERSIEDLALLFFSEVYPKQNTVLNRYMNPTFLHLLHLFHWSRVPTDRKYKIIKREKHRRPYVSSATELQHSGITFKRKNSGSFIDITFDEGCLKMFGTINIPVVHIKEYNSIIFRNLLAFEQTNTEIGGCFTAYSAWLAHLLQSEEDVKLFRKNRIVPNTPTPDNEVVQFFQDLKTETEITNQIPELYNLFKMVGDHNEGTLNQCYGAFKLRYCSNFWVTFGLVIFGIVTLLQTIYTALSYYATLSGNRKQ